MFLNLVFRTTNQVEHIRKQQTIGRADEPPARIPSRRDDFEKVVPVLQTQDPRLRFFKYSELLRSTFFAELFRVEVFASQNQIHILQPRALETHSDADAE